MSSFPPGTGLSQIAFSIINGITRTVGEMYAVNILVSCIRKGFFSWLLTAKVILQTRINNKETDSEAYTILGCFNVF